MLKTFRFHFISSGIFTSLQKRGFYSSNSISAPVGLLQAMCVAMWCQDSLQGQKIDINVEEAISSFPYKLRFSVYILFVCLFFIIIIAVFPLNQKVLILILDN